MPITVEEPVRSTSLATPVAPPPLVRSPALEEPLSSRAPTSVQSPHPLTDGRYRRLWLGSAISLLGDQFYLVALPWVVLQITGSAVAMGTILMTAAIPRAVLMLMGGALTDRLSPRRIMLATAMARTVFVGAVGALLWFNVLRIWELYALGFAFGVADAFSMPAASSYLPLLIKRDQLVRANSLSQTTTQLTTIVAPAPAGLVIKSLGAACAFVLDAVSFLFIIAALWSLPDPPRPQAPARSPMWKSILDGIRYVRQDTALSSLMALAAMLNLCVSGPMAVGLAYMAKTEFGSPTAYGFAVSALAAGGLTGALTAGVWKIARRGLFLLAASAVIGVCVGSLGFVGSLGVVAGVLFVMASAAAATNIHLASWIQGRVDPSVRGRVVSVLMLCAFGLMPISLAAAGFLVAWSLTGMFLLAGGAMLAVTAIGASRASVRAIA